MQEAALIPELLVTDLARSLDFYRGVLGFEVLYDRPEEGFASLKRGAAEIMLEAWRGEPDAWVTAPLAAPFGRGINFQIACEDVEALAARVARAGLPFFRPLATARYRVVGRIVVVRRFLVQDPDGYLLRFAEDIGAEPA